MNDPTSVGLGHHLQESILISPQDFHSIQSSAVAIWQSNTLCPESHTVTEPSSIMDYTSLSEPQMFQRYQSHTCYSMPLISNSRIHDLWCLDVPRLALRFDFLLDVVLACSAIHFYHTEFIDPEIPILVSFYIEKALQTWRDTSLSAKGKSEEAAAVAASLLKVLIWSCRALEYHISKPKSRLVHLFEISEQLNLFVSEIKPRIKDYNVSHFLKALNFSNEQPALGPGLHTAERYQDLALALRDIEQQIEIDEFSATYRESLQQFVTAHGHLHSDQLLDSRRLSIIHLCTKFPPKFLVLVERRQPLGLAILARFLALWYLFEGVWWIGSIAEREMEGIRSLMPQDSLHLMDWPRKTISYGRKLT